MSQASNRQTDLEMGDGSIQAVTGIFTTDRPYFVNSLTCKVGDQLSQSTPNQPLCPPQEECDLGDISGTIYSQYSKLAEEEDNNMARRFQKDADGILIFVRLRCVIQATVRIKLEHCRPAYSLPPSPRCSPCPFRT
jgi:hypothetical protein